MQCLHTGGQWIGSGWASSNPLVTLLAIPAVLAATGDTVSDLQLLLLLLSLFGVPFYQSLCFAALPIYSRLLLLLLLPLLLPLPLRALLSTLALFRQQSS